MSKNKFEFEKNNAAKLVAKRNKGVVFLSTEDYATVVVPAHRIRDARRDAAMQSLLSGVTIEIIQQEPVSVWSL